MFVDLTLEQALELLGDARPTLEERIVPALAPPAPNSPYVPEYEWMFAAERGVIRRLQAYLGTYRDHLVGAGGLLSEALSNAYCHAHRRDPALPITIRGLTGRRGVLIRVEDSGPGFDVEGAMRRRAAGRRYFQVAGSGMRRMAESELFQVFYDPAGSAVNLLHIVE